MTKKLNDILAAARQPVASVEEQIEQYLDYLSTLTEEEIEEEIESLDELSKHTLGRYIKGAGDDRSDSEFNNGFWYGQKGKDSTKNMNRAIEAAAKRKKGISKAVDKMTGRAKVNASEEVEPIDELSKKTLGSYVQKAATNLAARSVNLGLDVAHSTSNKIEGKPSDYNDKNIQVHATKMSRRLNGINRAAGGLAKEEVVAESTSYLVTLSDPNNAAVSRRSEKVQKKISIANPDESKHAQLIKNHYGKQGLRVHDITKRS